MTRETLTPPAPILDDHLSPARLPGKVGLVCASLPVPLLLLDNAVAKLATGKGARATQRVFVLPLAHGRVGVRP